MGYYLIMGIVLALSGVALISCPRQAWQFARGWRFANPAEVQLSAAYVAWLRMSGAAGVVIGVVLFVYAFR